MDFLVGTFNTPHIYTLRFTPSETSGAKGELRILARTDAVGSHSWLCLSPTKSHLYATAWTEPPSIAAYKINQSSEKGYAIPDLLNTKPIAARSGYVCCSNSHIYSAGGPSGEVFAIAEDGSVGDLVQELSFVDEEVEAAGQADGAARPHGDFGGLRHGAHSADLSPDGRKLYIADIGRNCVWAYSINDGQKHLTPGGKHIAPREGDGPRHAWPHPNGKVLYSLQEHSCMVDVFDVGVDGVSLRHIQGVRIIPEDKDPKAYWADEVRTSTTPSPRYVFASTRGLKPETRGYVAVFAIGEDGSVKDEKALCIWETPTSGGWANAIEPAPFKSRSGPNPQIEWLALTDSEEGWISILGFDGTKLWEEARVKLEEGAKVAGAATAVWL